METNVYLAMAITGFFSAIGGGIAQIIIRLHIEPRLAHMANKVKE